MSTVARVLRPCSPARCTVADRPPRERPNVRHRRDRGGRSGCAGHARRPGTLPQLVAVSGGVTYVAGEHAHDADRPACLPHPAELPKLSAADIPSLFGSESSHLLEPDLPEGREPAGSDASRDWFSDSMPRRRRQGSAAPSARRLAEKGTRSTRPSRGTGRSTCSYRCVEDAGRRDRRRPPPDGGGGLRRPDVRRCPGASPPAGARPGGSPARRSSASGWPRRRWSSPSRR